MLALRRHPEALHVSPKSYLLEGIFQGSQKKSSEGKPAHVGYVEFRATLNEAL